MSILGISKVKQILNSSKMEDEVSKLPLTGDIYEFHIKKEDLIQLYYKRILTQTEIDEVENYLNNFIETSAFQEELNRINVSMQEGFGLYQKIFADITLEGGLYPAVDNQGSPQPFLDESLRLYCGYSDVQTMVIPLKDIRCMLKDNMYESTLRSFSIFMDPTVNFSAEQMTRYQDWLAEGIKAVDASFGIDPAVSDAKIAAIKTAPKGFI